MFCTGGTVDGAAVKFLFDNTKDPDLDDPVFVEHLNKLYVAGVIDLACMDRFAAFGADSPPPPLPTGYSKRFRVPLANASGHAIKWVGGYLTSEAAITFDDTWIYISTEGACTAPGAEVI